MALQLVLLRKCVLVYCDSICFEADSPFAAAVFNQLMDVLASAEKIRESVGPEGLRQSSLPGWSVIRDAVHMLTIRIDEKLPVHPRDFGRQICELSGCTMDNVAEWMGEGSEPDIRYQAIIWRWVQNHEKRERMVSYRLNAC